jgi:acetyl-CoA C-acetyltransferase
MARTVIVSGARTPIGRFGGAFGSLKAADLGGIVIKEVLKRAEVDGKDVGEVIFGTVLQASQGQIPSRQAAHAAGLDWDVKTETINKVCASGLRSITLADQIIRCGDESLIVAGGMESMSNAPYYLENARWGYRLGNNEAKDSILADGITCAYSGLHMGIYGGNVATEHNISRGRQDEWAVNSHLKAVKAQKEGLFKDEIVPVEVPQRKGNSLLVEVDEGPRADTTLEKLAKLRPAFDKDATVTAGNASSINDGAAAVVLMSEERALAEGKAPFAYVLGHAAIGVEAKDFPLTPGYAINALLKKTGKTVDEIDLFEVNEAFALVALACEETAGVDLSKMNVNGGAVGLGHPIGASGCRIVVTLMHALKQRGGGIGIAAICSGGGQGDAIMIEVPKSE